MYEYTVLHLFAGNWGKTVQEMAALAILTVLYEATAGIYANIRASTQRRIFTKKQINIFIFFSFFSDK